jgi:hypothetical protein
VIDGPLLFSLFRLCLLPDESPSPNNKKFGSSKSDKNWTDLYVTLDVYLDIKLARAVMKCGGNHLNVRLSRNSIFDHIIECRLIIQEEKISSYSLSVPRIILSMERSELVLEARIAEFNTVFAL